MDAEYIYFLFEVATVAVLVFALVYLFVLSIIVRDYRMIVERPFIFVVELIFMMVLPALPILFFYVSRGTDFHKAMAWASSLAAKFGIFHIVMQLSGMYSFLFAT